MMALLRKDRDWLLLFFVVGNLAMLGALIDTRFEEIWMFPFERGDSIFHVGWISGLCLGLFAATRDELTGTREFLLHRPVSQYRIHGIKLLGCALVMSSWLTLPLAVQLIGETLSRSYTGPLTWSNLCEVWALDSVIFSSFAVGLFCGTLPEEWRLRAVLVAITQATLLAFAIPPSAEDAAIFNFGAGTILHSIAAITLTAASFANIRSAHDPDQPPFPIQLWIGKGLMAVILTGGLSLYIYNLQSWPLNALVRATPNLVQFADGEVGLAIWRDTKWHHVDREHRLIETEVNTEPAQILWEQPEVLGGPTVFDLFNEPRFHVSQQAGLFSRLAEDGLLYRYGPAVGTRRPRRLTSIGRGPKNLPFSPSAHLLAYDYNSVWIGEPEENGLWRYDVTRDKAFTFIAFPEGGRFVRGARLESDSTIVSSMLEHRKSIVTDGNVYVIVDSELALATDKIQGPDPAQQAAQEVTILSADLLSPSILYTDKPSNTTFRHEFAPHTLTEKTWATIATLFSMLRPPVFAIHSYLSPMPTALTSAHPLTDPLLRGSKRAWLLTLMLATSAYCGFRASTRLKRARAPRNKRLFGTIVAIAFGHTGLWTTHLPGRDYALPYPQEKPAMLIHTPVFKDIQ